MHPHRTLGVIALGALVAASATACSRKDAVRADSLQALATQQVQLMGQLASQKDSLTRVVLDADKFIASVDSQISTVKGLPQAKRKEALESPIQEQLVQRKEMLARVDALVKRTKATAVQLAEARKREAEMKGEIDKLGDANAKLQAQLEQEQQTIADLNATIQRQTTTIASLEARVDSLNVEMKTLGTQHFRAYFVVGTEKELLQKGVVVREGGANLVLMHPGRTLQPARTLDPAAFTPIDQRDVREIYLPDTTRRYQVVSRQSLDDAEVAERDKASFRSASLKIANPEKFWSQSRFLILLER